MPVSPSISTVTSWAAAMHSCSTIDVSDGVWLTSLRRIFWAIVSAAGSAKRTPGLSDRRAQIVRSRDCIGHTHFPHRCGDRWSNDRWWAIDSDSSTAKLAGDCCTFDSRTTASIAMASAKFGSDHEHVAVGFRIEEALHLVEADDRRGNLQRLLQVELHGLRETRIAGGEDEPTGRKHERGFSGPGSFKFQVPSSKFQVGRVKLGTWNLELGTHIWQKRNNRLNVITSLRGLFRVATLQRKESLQMARVQTV